MPAILRFSPLRALALFLAAQGCEVFGMPTDDPFKKPKKSGLAYLSPQGQARARAEAKQAAVRSSLPRARSYSSAATRSYIPPFPWKRNITATIFWVGERPTPKNPTPNHMSSWDSRWVQSYGGYDDPNPKNRVANFRLADFRPKGFLPKQNPFYIALPYNDVKAAGVTKREAARVIPWYKRLFRKHGRTVLKGTWVAVRKGKRTCFAQWEDVGPFNTDDWKYVFGNARPNNSANKGAGIDVSPSVRDYLGLRSGDKVNWRFVKFQEIYSGPWARYGDNNQLRTKYRQLAETEADKWRRLREMRDRAYRSAPASSK